MKTAEEILIEKKIIVQDEPFLYDIPTSEIIEAMEEYASQFKCEFPDEKHIAKILYEQLPFTISLAKIKQISKLILDLIKSKQNK